VEHTSSAAVAAAENLMGTGSSREGAFLRKRTIMLIIAIGLLFGTLGLWLRSRITPEQVRVRIEHELALGSGSGRVLLFLDSLKAEHSGPVSSRDYQFPGATRMVAAAIRGFRKGDLFSDGIFMEFHFDDRDKLVGYRVEYSYTAP